ncbi:MAG: hypothetical protein M1827_007528 [Pycnora praestabilis]|nr:MAG: hypothetical protein M1827_007528 [Pycnora praestabilis]
MALIKKSLSVPTNYLTAPPEPFEVPVAVTWVHGKYASGPPGDAPPLLRLPIELRREVYSHLLDGKMVKKPQPTRQNPYYQFETAILAVNWQIHNEAQEFMEEKNIFVRVSTSWKGVFEGLITIKVPVVSIHRVMRMKHPALSVMLRFLRESEIKKRSYAFLLLQSDLPLLCRYLRMYNLTCSTEHLQKTTSSPQHGLGFLKSDGNPEFGMVIGLQMNHTSDCRQHSVRTQKLLLEPFREVVGAVQEAFV